MIKGSCLCGGITFSINGKPEAASHCHCRMCQKQHGAAYATYARFARSQIEYHSGQELLASYNSSADVMRRFCKVCGANVEWGYEQQRPEKVAIAVGLFDTEFDFPVTVDLHLESKASWLRGD